MSQTLRVWTAFEVVIDGKAIAGGHRSKPQEVTVDDPYIDVTKAIAVTTTWDAWGFSTEEAFSSFDFLWIESSLDGVLVELTTDKGDEVGNESFVIELKADKPFVLFTDTGRANYTADFAGGSADLIDRVRIRNPSASTVANVRFALFKAA